MKKIRFSMLPICALASCALWVAQTASSEFARAAPSAKKVSSKVASRAKSSSCANPRGRRLTIYGNFLVTNSDDGFRDHRAEVYGYVTMKGKRMWTVQGTSPQRVSKGFLINLSQPVTHDLIFDDPSTWKVIVTGFMLERDKGGDDGMWNSHRLPLVVNIKEMYDKRPKMVLPGDRNSESADLILQFGPMRSSSYIY